MTPPSLLQFGCCPQAVLNSSGHQCSVAGPQFSSTRRCVASKNYILQSEVLHTAMPLLDCYPISATCLIDSSFLDLYSDIGYSMHLHTEEFQFACVRIFCKYISSDQEAGR